ncbi:MAG: hypothetical protein LBS45_08275 [Synergistaceae bacterium]|jgi:hypothetical protein|nr:hypothetical protein [Synergistaceae bacterium]
MRRGNLKIWVFLLLLASVFTSGGCGGSSNDGAANFAGGSGTSADPWRIATAGQLNGVRNHLDGHFVLTGDIDLSSYSNWAPIGVFVPISEAPEDEETPVIELTFTGVFDGGGHTISNVTINAPESAGVGLFGCVAGTGAVSNLTVANANVQGQMLVAGVIGYGMGSSVENVKLTGNNNIKGAFLVGGIVGGGFCDIVGCAAQANVTLLGDKAQGAGVLAGGMETSDIIDCSATGTVTALGSGNIGVGGLVACAMYSESVLRCTYDVTITVGENNVLIGGLLGYAGIANGAGDSATLISDCSGKAVINAPADAERIGGIAGGGFFVQEYREYISKPGAIRVTNCQTSGEINGGYIVGSVLGYAYDNSSVEGCTSDMKVNGAAAKQVGATLNDITLDDLW